ncbi:hypothetical protein [Tolypothrix sp. PCC 7601]|uniref:hypothetical protein n=1 Tax=Tolypothrix sp. PCC 7601 TaxID=1188 RepID=UPI0021E06E42|nr:hypothetical protein [Tolypothrix sp. PCC 7601]UYD38971.1 hypothetical protein HG267_41525 [Tolypothrix sp. PCC 7601]
MWKLGDKCQALKPNSQGMTTAEITEIYPKTNFCDLQEIGTSYKWLATLDELICYYLAINLGVKMCSQLDNDAPRCETCPRSIEAQSLDI